MDPIWELWWDGANGEGPNGKKQVYDWHRFEKTVSKFHQIRLCLAILGRIFVGWEMKMGLPVKQIGIISIQLDLLRGMAHHQPIH